jgi:RHS repeat-associated protein
VTSGSLTTTTTTTDYLGGFQYQDGVLQFFPTAEGYVQCTPFGGSSIYNYVFQYTDHLGNIRLTYSNGHSGLAIMEENNYYPYGLKHVNYNAQAYTYSTVRGGGFEVDLAPVEESIYKYKFNGQERQEELGLGVYDMAFRDYDPAIGRWMNMDPLAEQSRRFSPYTYALNNPVFFIDPDGMRVSPSDHHWQEFRDDGTTNIAEGQDSVGGGPGDPPSRWEKARDAAFDHETGNTDLLAAMVNYVSSFVTTEKAPPHETTNENVSLAFVSKNGDGQNKTTTANVKQTVEADGIIASSPTAISGNKYSTFVDGLEYVNSLTEAFTKGSEAAEAVMEQLVSIKTEKYSATEPLGGGRSAAASVVKTESTDTVVKISHVKNVVDQNRQRYEREKRKADNLNK